jgi:hypothetical protein
VSVVDLSPLATGMQLAGNPTNPEDFVIRAFPGNQQHQACTPHPHTGTMLIRPFSAPASTSPHFEVLSLGARVVLDSGISRREITMNDVRDELDTIFAQLPAAKASPMKASPAKKFDAVTVDIDASPAANLSKSAVKKALVMTPTSDACVQTDLSDTAVVNEGSTVAEVTRDVEAVVSVPVVAPAAVVNININDGKANYAWGNSGRSLRFSAATAARFGLRTLVPDAPVVAEPAKQQQVTADDVSAASDTQNKNAYAWGKNHTMVLSKAAAATFGMRVIIPESPQAPSSPELVQNVLGDVMKTPPRSALTAARTPLSSAVTVGPKRVPPTPACSPEDDDSTSPCVTPSKAVDTTTDEVKKAPRIIRFSTFDAAAVLRKLENGGITPPRCVTPSDDRLAGMTLAELASTPLHEVYPELFGPGGVILI